MEAVCYDCLSEMEKISSGFNVSNHPQDSKFPMVQRGDLYECPSCGYKIYSDFGKRHQTDNSANIIWVK